MKTEDEYTEKDKNKALEIATYRTHCCEPKSITDQSVYSGCLKMAQYKNEEFKQLLREHCEDFVDCGDWDGWGRSPCFEVEDFIKTYLEN